MLLNGLSKVKIGCVSKEKKRKDNLQNEKIFANFIC
jgi:hypothetical protein